MASTSTLSPLPSPHHAPSAPFGVDEGLLRRSRSLNRFKAPEPALVQQARGALLDDDAPKPELASDGVGGAYFLRSAEEETPFAVFKPSDEEPGAQRDAKRSLSSSSLLMPPGGGAVREVAAYALDQLLPEYARAGVPETHLVAGLSSDAFSGGARLAKSGSLQRFVPSAGTSDSISPSLFIAEDVHKVGVLDLRLFNLDRNEENLLLRLEPTLAPHSGRRVSAGPPCFHLVPIDHAYSLPPTPHGAFFEWQHWAQAKLPFSPSMLFAIEGIDLEQEAALLASLGLDSASIRTHWIAGTWLKVGAREGLTLHQLASFAAAPMPDESSLLERVLVEIEPLAQDEAAWKLVLSEILRDAARLVRNNSARTA